MGRKKKEPVGELLVCYECGGTNVEHRAWVDANTKEFKSDAWDDDNDTWCNDCEDHRGLVKQSEFIAHKDEDDGGEEDT